MKQILVRDEPQTFSRLNFTTHQLTQLYTNLISKETALKKFKEKLLSKFKKVPRKKSRDGAYGQQRHLLKT